jgi:S-formylglutathione hydrolase FrmB
VVAPNDGRRYSAYVWRPDAADGSDRVEDRLLREVIPAVEGAIAATPHRAIGGFSMGGFGSINLALPPPGH